MTVMASTHKEKSKTGGSLASSTACVASVNNVHLILTLGVLNFLVATDGRVYCQDKCWNGDLPRHREKVKWPLSFYQCTDPDEPAINHSFQSLWYKDGDTDDSVTDCETTAYTRFKIGKYKLFFSIWKEICSSLFWVVTQCMLIAAYWFLRQTTGLIFNSQAVQEECCGQVKVRLYKGWCGW